MAYEIPIDVGALDKLVERLEAAAKATTGLDANVKTLNASLSQTRMKGGGGGSGPPPVASGMSPSGDGFDDYAYRRIRNEARAIQYKNAFGGGADPYTTYAARRIRNQEMRERFAAEMGGDTRAAALARTRVGPDGKLYPLMRDLGALGGIVPGGGSIAEGLASSVGSGGPWGAVTATVAAMQAARTIAGANANAYFATGGTPSEIGRLSGMGSDAPGRAVAFGDTLRAGGMASGYFRSHGLVDRGPYQTDKATNYFKAIDVLRNEPNEGRAIRMAREAGLSEELRYRYMSPGLYGDLMNGGKGPSSDQMRLRSDVEGQWERLKRNAFESPATDFMLRRLNSVFENPFEAIVPLFNGVGAIGDALDTWRGRARQSPQSKLAESTQAVNNDYQYLGERMQGGVRAHAAANIGMAVGAINNQGLQHSMRIGAFPVY